jgi:hypothetical protein
MFRRALGMTLAIAAGLVSTVTGQVQTKESQAAVTPVKAMEMLVQGNDRFLAGKGKVRDLNA